jgi:hypothetical protein
MTGRGGPRYEPSLGERGLDLLRHLREDAAEWASDEKSWVARLPVLAYVGYGFVRHLQDPLYATFLFGGITLGIHEMGHLAFSWAPQFLHVAGGTLFQLAAPVAAGVVFVRQRDYFGGAVAGAWLAFSLFNVATYMADARRYELDYVNVGGGEVEAQDWDHMLSALGILTWDTRLATLTRLLAFAVGAASLCYGSWLLWTMARARSRPGPS